MQDLEGKLCDKSRRFWMKPDAYRVPGASAVARNV